jgi:hypothetical protein
MDASNMKLQLLPLSILVSFLISPNLRADFCPTPPTRVDPNVGVKISFDKKSKLYTYRYTLSNGRSALLPIDEFILRISKPPTRVGSPSNWDGSPFVRSGVQSHFIWDTAFAANYVAPGGEKSGFEIESPYEPGVIQYYVLGRTETRVGTPTADDDEPTPDCEGFYDDKPMLDGMVSGITQGPVSDGRLSLDIELKDSKGERECGPVSPYEDKGLLNVLVKGKKDFNVDDLDLTTLKFGVGQAPVVSSRKLGKSDNLLLQFNTQAVEIECGRDRVLFLTGKTKTGIDVLGGVEVKTKNCDKRTKRVKLRPPGSFPTSIRDRNKPHKSNSHHRH